MAPRGPRWRLHVALGGAALVASGFLTWWRAGGGEVAGVPIPPAEGIGLEGVGLALHAVGVAALLLLNLGYLRGDRGAWLDAPAAYLSLGLVGLVALLARGWELWTLGYVPIPEASPGFAVAALGIGFMLFGAGTGINAGLAER